MKPEGQPLGTGFLVAKDLVLTNHHVAFDADLTFRNHSESFRFRFGFREPADGPRRRARQGPAGVI
jgi:hypothetical protein